MTTGETHVMSPAAAWVAAMNEAREAVVERAGGAASGRYLEVLNARPRYHGAGRVAAFVTNDGAVEVYGAVTAVEAPGLCAWIRGVLGLDERIAS